MEFGEVVNSLMILMFIGGIFLAFRYLDGRAKARKKYRKPKYKQFKVD